MRTTAEIRAAIRKLQADDRFKQKPALVEVNAPLALIQTDLSARIRALQWVLELHQEIET